MKNSKKTKYVDLANSNLAQLIIELPDCRKAAICFFISGDPDVVPGILIAYSPSGRDRIVYFTDHTLLRILDDVAIPFYSLKDFVDSLCDPSPGKPWPVYLKRFCRQALLIK